MYGDAFLDTTLKTQSLKEILISWTSLKLKISVLWKTVFWELEDKSQTGEKISTEDVSDKGLLSKIYTKHLKLNKKTSPLQNRLKTLIDTIKEEILMANKSMKICSTY